MPTNTPHLGSFPFLSHFPTPYRCFRMTSTLAACTQILVSGWGTLVKVELFQDSHASPLPRPSHKRLGSYPSHLTHCWSSSPGRAPAWKVPVDVVRVWFLQRRPGSPGDVSEAREKLSQVSWARNSQAFHQVTRPQVCTVGLYCRAKGSPWQSCQTSLGNLSGWLQGL